MSGFQRTLLTYCTLALGLLLATPRSSLSWLARMSLDARSDPERPAGLPTPRHLDEAAVRMMMSMAFLPAERDGKPVAGRYPTVVKWHLQ